MPSFYGAINLQKNELQNAVVQNLGSAPGTPSKGQIYFDSGANILYYYNGSAWVATSGTALTPATTVTTQAVGDAAVVGTSTNYAREDHKHGREAFAAPTAEITFGTGSSAGTALTVPHSDHTHGNPVHDAAAHSAIPISALSLAGGPINMNGYGINNVGAPVGNSDAANKNYVDNSIAGLSWKRNVQAATTANIALTGNQAIDGYTTFTGDRVLVKNQTTAGQNGIYTAATGAWVRATDADADVELVNAAVYVSQGTTQADTGWVCTTNLPITVGTTALTWVQFTGAANIVGGAGLTHTGNTLDVVAADTSLTINADNMLVNTAVITPTARLINTTAPLTGGGNLTADRTLAITNFAGSTPGAVPTSPGGTTQFLRADGTWAAPAGSGLSKFAATLTGTASPETVTHNLNTRDIQLTVYNGASPYTAVEVDWDAATLTTATVRYNPNLGAGYRVVVVG